MLKKLITIFTLSFFLQSKSILLTQINPLNDAMELIESIFPMENSEKNK